MATPANIEVFNVVSARVFVELYESFPTPITIDPALTGLNVLFEQEYGPESDEYKHLASSAHSTIQFLLDEGFIRKSSGPEHFDQRGFQNLVLTSKGFSLLQKTPESVDESQDRRSYFERLRALTGAGVRVIATEAIGPVISSLMGAV
ncbi:hypothetical protein [Luteimonas sp. e5]